MSKLLAHWSEKPLMEFLRRGGSINDPRGKSLVAKVIHAAIQDEDIRRITAINGFDAEDLCVLYVGMITSLMPKPCINVSGPMLAATLPLVESHRLEVMLSQLRHELDSASGIVERRMLILECAELNARVIQVAHESAYGEPNWTITPDGMGGYSAPTGAGCLGAVILSVCGVGSLFGFLLWCF